MSTPFESYPVLLELSHFDSIDSTFIAFVTQSASATILGLLQVIGGQQAIDDGDAARGIKACDAGSYSLADVVKVGCFSTNDTAENNDGIVTVVERHLVSPVDEFK